MIRRRRLAKDALMKATRVRRQAGLRPDEAMCVYDLAGGMDVEVRFLDLPSLEGMYSKKPEPVIVISSLRPPGRQAYTCGHELGHHVFGHGFRIDQLLAADPLDEDDDEFLVDCFAGFLLMPKAAVLAAFSQRGWNPESSTPVQIFTIAGWLGVGYETLIVHMRASLGILGNGNANALRKATPKAIKSDLLGEERQENLVVIDRFWAGRAVDLQVGDYVLGMPGVESDKTCIRVVQDDGQESILQAVGIGLGRIMHRDSGWSSFVRISRRGYVGRSIFRHDAEVGDDDGTAVCE